MRWPALSQLRIHKELNVTRKTTNMPATMDGTCSIRLHRISLTDICCNYTKVVRIFI